MSSEITLREWLEQNKNKISGLDAELILMRAIRERFGEERPDRSWLVAHDEAEMTDAEQLLAEKMLQRRQAGEPMAYILGEKEFFGRKFEVSKNVLIPRPETEGVVELVLGLIDRENNAPGGTKNNEKAEALYNPSLDIELPKEVENSPKREDGSERGEENEKKVRVLEVGTGSGCIAVTLALERPEIEMITLDISQEALIVARKNAIKLGAKVAFWQSDLLQQVKNSGVLPEELDSSRQNGDDRGIVEPLKENKPSQDTKNNEKAEALYNPSLDIELPKEVENSPKREDGSERGEENENFEPKIDILVANLPYVDEKWDWLDRKTLDFEPKIALFAEQNGLEAYQRLLGQMNYQKVAKWAVFEVDPCQHTELAKMARENGFEMVETRGFGMVLKFVGR